MKTLFFIIMIVSCMSIGCHNLKPEDKRARFERLVSEKKNKEANLLVDTLIKNDSSNGYLYYSKGMLEMQLLHFPIAERCFKKAYKLNYDTSACVINLMAVHYMMEK